MKFFCLFLGFSFLTMVSCKSQKAVITQAELDTFKTMVNSQHFYIESSWAYPLNTNAMQQVLNSGLLQPGNSSGNISLVGNYNFLKVAGDSVTSHLPYYGERRMQVAYGGTDSAIEFNGSVKNYNVQQNKDASYTISFEAKSNSENFNVYIKLFPNNKSDIILTSASRNSISYSGEVKPTKSLE